MPSDIICIHARKEWVKMQMGKGKGVYCKFKKKFLVNLDQLLLKVHKRENF
jgi:hypothetical protein